MELRPGKQEVRHCSRNWSTFDVKDERSVSGPLIPGDRGRADYDRTDGGKTRKFDPLGSQRLGFGFAAAQRENKPKFFPTTVPAESVREGKKNKQKKNGGSASFVPFINGCIRKSFCQKYSAAVAAAAAAQRRGRAASVPRKEKKNKAAIFSLSLVFSKLCGPSDGRLWKGGGEGIKNSELFRIRSNSSNGGG